MKITNSSGYNVTFEATKYKCDGSVTSMGVNSYMTKTHGEAYDILYGFNLHNNNNNDYVTVVVTCYGKYDFQEANPQTQSFTYDVNNIENFKIHTGYYDIPHFKFYYEVDY